MGLLNLHLDIDDVISCAEGRLGPHVRWTPAYIAVATIIGASLAKWRSFTGNIEDDEAFVAPNHSRLPQLDFRRFRSGGKGVRRLTG